MLDTGLGACDLSPGQKSLRLMFPRRPHVFLVCRSVIGDLRTH